MCFQWCKYSVHEVRKFSFDNVSADCCIELTNYHFGSLKHGGPLEFERLAYQQYYDDGVLIVAAAGNDGTSQYIWPASYESVISVAGTFACSITRIHRCN
jgi:hypothetical protein